MQQRFIRCNRSWVVTVLGVLLSLSSGQASGQVTGLTHPAVETGVPQVVQMGVGASQIIESPVPFTRASIAKPEVADTLVLSPKQIYLTGKAVGTTTLTLWGQNGKVFKVFDVLVTPDLNALKAQIHEVFPHETGVKVTAGHDNLTLSGVVSSAENLTKIVEMAEPYAPQKVVNLLQVGGVHQVMLEVHVAEMNRGLVRRMGFNFSKLRSGADFFFGELNDLSQFTVDGDKFEFTEAAVINTILAFPAGGATWVLFFDLLKQHNLSRVLAEPTLVTISGQEASFLAGGEFPIPVPQAFGVTTIRFREFGVKLNFNPTVLNDKKIALKIRPEVSELDFANGVNLQGFTVPAITTRRVETVLEMGDGQSFVIAGLLQDNIRETVAKYPVLGDIPVLGTLFRSTQFQKNETELVIIVTPRLVKPIDLAHQTLPTDGYLEPNDFEQMLLGYLEGVPKPIEPPVSSGLEPMNSASGLHSWKGGGLEGVFGHLAPEGAMGGYK